MTVYIYTRIYLYTCFYTYIYVSKYTTGFLPLEPSMGGIEECKGSCCHGALMEMTANEYQKIWLSEGGGQADPGNIFICMFFLYIHAHLY
jgi:hypothetical protein